MGTTPKSFAFSQAHKSRAMNPARVFLMAIRRGNNRSLPAPFGVCLYHRGSRCAFGETEGGELRPRSAGIEMSSWTSKVAYRIINVLGCLESESSRRYRRNDVKQDDDTKDGRFEFKIDGEQLYAPHESITVAELIQIALDAKVLDPVQEGYTLEDGKGNTFAPDAVIDLDKTNVFYATENEPGPAS